MLISIVFIIPIAATIKAIEPIPASMSIIVLVDLFISSIISIDDDV